MDLAIAKLTLETRQKKRLLNRIKATNAHAKELLQHESLKSHQQDNNVEEAKGKELAQNALILGAKAAEYKDRIRELSANFGYSSTENDLTSIECLTRDIDFARTNHLRPKQETLAAFKELPPDIHLANLMLAEKKAYLSELIRRKDKLLQSITL